MKRRIHCLPVLLLATAILVSDHAVAQKRRKEKLSKADKVLVASLKTHISYLAHDKLEGRRAGTPGEKLAMEYISTAFQKYNLEPKGTNGYYQPFEIYDGRQIDPETFLIINGSHLKVGKDFFPFPFSANGSIESMPSVALHEQDMPWFFDLKDGIADNKNNPHFDLMDYIRNNVKKARERGATAVILYNSVAEEPLQFNSKDRSEVTGIPVIYIHKETAAKYFSDESETLDIQFKVSISEKTRTGYNVVGYISNNAERTIVLGAHYDHLGYGEDGNSMIRTGEKLIHNGADDNASGTAALIELAGLLKASGNKNSNYLFIAFSAEELGLNGSKFFVENPTINIGSVNFMINMDMIGRLNDSSRVLTVGGFGTSPLWSSVVKLNQRKPPFQIRIDSSGSGPSDHTSFYRKDIPVLFFFTGLHTDYHKPGDDADKINYTGQLRIVQFISQVISNAAAYDQKLVFTKTREAQTTTSARFSVSLGIMPDYTFTGAGVRCDGVSEDRPAMKAGLKAGDIILQLGEHSVNSMEAYMQTLGKFKKGDKAKLKYKRGEEVFETEVQF